MGDQERITVEVSTDAESKPSEVLLYLNESGLEALIRELQALSKSNDHFHCFAREWGEPDDVLCVKPYSASGITVGHLKVLFRPDDWDQEYYPHLFEDRK